MLQQFALASVNQRSIAWLIRLDDWDRFEQIVKYNSAMVGGYFNAIVPLTSQDTISQKYQQFLVDYDPDLIVLVPGMTANWLDSLSVYFHPFGIIPWEDAPAIVMLDPWGGVSGTNATLGAITTFKKESSAVKTFVAVADNAFPDMSRLALVACGDIEPREPMWDVVDEDVSLDATGHREMFLTKLLNPQYNQINTQTHLEDNQKIVLAPDRYQLADMISEEHKFPLFNSVNILKTCFKMQHFPEIYQSLIGLTAKHKKGGTPERIINDKEKHPPAIVILMSDNFSIEEATLFWNLRASGIYVGWLSFLEVESHIDEVAKWLNSDYVGSLFLMGIGTDIAFTSPSKEFSRLKTIVDKLLRKRKQNFPLWQSIPHYDLIFYNYVKPSLRQERIMIVKNETGYTFIPKLPQEHFSGVYVVSLKWNGLMLPQNSTLVHDLISSETLRNPFLIRDSKSAFTSKEIAMPRFRITNDRYLEAQISSEEPIVFTRPSSEQIIETLFLTARFSYIEQSSTAKYHLSFIHRAGSLEEAAHYLAKTPYRELLEVLADNSDKSKSGWILDNPSKRRVLHHLHLRQVLRKSIPLETNKYFDTVSDELPNEAIRLLEQSLLERGFLLKCTSCSFSSWYPTEHVGQVFECSRCFQSQVYRSNPLWLYKLPEVIFQGFEDNMQVPLLALNYLKSTSRHYFEWVPDSNVYWLENGKESHKNVDILCICDGKFYIGEAKSNDEIEADQFSFYENVCRRVMTDGIVFATSKLQWKRSTLQRIEQLKTQFKGKVIILTGKDLYPST